MRETKKGGKKFNSEVFLNQRESQTSAKSLNFLREIVECACKLIF